MTQNKTNPIPRIRTAITLAVALSAGAIGLAQDDEEEIYELSPFEASGSENDLGYHSENTLMGTRLNSNIGDLAASITLVTKQQMEDTGSVDMNDIFLYEGNTEGAHNYTAYHTNRGYLKDEAAGISQDNGTVYSAATSNRIRGLGAADTSVNNYPTISRVPFDSYNTNSVQISRGPNSTLFGMGSPAGIVNQTTASAAIGDNSTSLSFRIDDRGGWRASFNRNQTLIEDTLAVFVAGLHDERKFDRKPSYDDTDRLYLSFKYKPAENTTFRASFEDYSNESRRPNTIAPRDGITPWISAGRPVWDNKTKMVEFLDTGVQQGPYSSTSEFWTTDDPLFTGVIEPFSGRSSIFINPNGSVANAFEPSLWRDRPDEPAPDDPNYDAFIATRNSWTVRTTLPWVGPWIPQLPNDGGAAMSPYYPTGLIDKSIYDWENVNVTAPNFQTLDSNSYNLEFEQKLSENLYFSAGWFRQEADSVENNPISNTSPTTVLLDVSKYLLDGSNNPNYLSPFIDDYRADVFTHPETNDNLRAQLAYELDFTDRDNWAKHLGQHQAMALWSRNETDNRATRSRIGFYDEPNGGYYYAQNPADWRDDYSFGAENSAIRRYYYLGSNAQVTQGNVGIGGAGIGGTGGQTDFNFNTFFWDDTSGGHFENVPVEIGTALWWPSTNRVTREIDSLSGGLQSKFWNGKIITTVGLREDDYSSTSYGGGREDAGYTGGLPTGGTDFYFTNAQGTEEIEGRTYTKGIVFKATEKISLTYNEADNFNPPGGNSTDFYGNALPKPTGEGKDYGIRFNLLENKLHAGINWFKTTSSNARGVPSVFIDRTQRIDYNFMEAWADKVVRIRHGADPTIEDWANNDIYPRSQAMTDEVWAMIGLDENFRNGVSVQGTQDTEAKGVEFQLTYNPLQNWTLKFNASKQTTSFANVAPQWEPWATERQAAWQAATATDVDASYMQFNGRELRLQNYWTAVGYKGGDIIDDHQWGWNTIRDYYQLTVLDEIATIRNKEGQIVNGQREWRANVLTNYVLTDGKFAGLGFGGSVRWEEAAAIGNYGIVSEDGVMRQPDISRPIYGDSELHADLWVHYRMDIGNNKSLKLQLNIRDAFESGGLQAIAANFDGSVYGYRFVDPRQFVFTSTLEF